GPRTRSPTPTERHNEGRLPVLRSKQQRTLREPAGHGRHGRAALRTHRILSRGRTRLMTTVHVVNRSDRDGHPHHDTHDTADQANTHADTIRRQGLGAYTYPVDIHD